MVDDPLSESPKRHEFRPDSGMSPTLNALPAGNAPAHPKVSKRTRRNRLWQQDASKIQVAGGQQRLDINAGSPPTEAEPTPPNAVPKSAERANEAVEDAIAHVAGMSPEDTRNSDDISDMRAATFVDEGDGQAHAAIAPADPELVKQKFTSAASVRIRRRGFFQDTPDRGLFIAFALIGFIGITIAKGYGFSAIGTAICSVGILVGYALTSYFIEWYRLHPDRLGDNCYYMGFLFTLASLSAALISVENQPVSLRGEMIETVIGNFGVALFSTVAGIALRVVFIQMRREIEDLEEHIRNDLQQASALLKDQLGMAVIDLESFRLRTQQVMAEQRDSAAASFAAGTGKLTKYIALAGEAYGEADLPRFFGPRLT